MVSQQQDLADWLLEERMVSTDQLEQAYQHQRETGTPLGMALLELKLLEEGTLVDLLARRYRMPKAPDRLHRLGVSLKALSFIPQDLCWQYGVFPFGIDTAANRLQVAIADPADEEAKQLLLELERIDPELYVVGPKALEKAIRKHYLDALVEDTHHGGRKMRFFGYEHITDPGVAPKAKRATAKDNAAVERPPGLERRPPHELTPEPELVFEAGAAPAEEAPLEVEVRVSRPRKTEISPAVAPAAPPNAAVAPGAPPTPALARMRPKSLRHEPRQPPSSTPTEPEEQQIALRVAALEGALEQLIDLLASRADAKTSEMLDRIRTLLGK